METTPALEVLPPQEGGAVPDLVAGLLEALVVAVQVRSNTTATREHTSISPVVVEQVHRVKATMAAMEPEACPTIHQAVAAAVAIAPLEVTQVELPLPVVTAVREPQSGAFPSAAAVAVAAQPHREPQPMVAETPDGTLPEPAERQTPVVAAVE